MIRINRERLHSSLQCAPSVTEFESAEFVFVVDRVKVTIGGDLKGLRLSVE